MSTPANITPIIIPIFSKISLKEIFTDLFFSVELSYMDVYAVMSNKSNPIPYRAIERNAKNKILLALNVITLAIKNNNAIQNNFLFVCDFCKYPNQKLDRNGNIDVDAIIKPIISKL